MPSVSIVARGRAALLAALLLLPPADLPAQGLREPLPVDVALSLRGHNGRSPMALSPDGQWVAHTIRSTDNVPRDTLSAVYSASGFSFAEGDGRMEATVTHTGTGEMIRLGGAASASWGAVWSPDGRRVAFYSDEGGTAGLWIWELATRRATRVPGFIVRPFFGFELATWLPDSQRLLVKVLPAGMTIAQANARGRTVATPSQRFPVVAPGQPVVAVRRAGFDPPPAAEGASTPTDMRWAEVDLALVDLRTRQVTRLVSGVAIRQVAVSPDGQQVAFSVSKGAEPNTQQSLNDLMVVPVAGGAPRTLAAMVRMSYGIEWSWSPDGQTVAYINSGQRGSGEIILLPVQGGAPRPLGGEGVPAFGRGEGEVPPYWSADGRQIYAVARGELWRLDVASGRGTLAGQIPGWDVRALITPFARPTVFAADGGTTVWAITRERDGGRAGIHAIDLGTGQGRLGLAEPKSYSAFYNVSASDATGELAFVSTGQQHLPEISVFSPAEGKARQVSRINNTLQAYRLGEARLIEWRDVDGRPLRGALLLPPGYEPGRRLPLVVQVYGGTMGSTYVNRFGLQGDSPQFNMHLLATRGFAVLTPDAPVRTGHTLEDVVRTVMPGINAAIDQGFVDPDRLAVMGQSYGSFNTLSILTQTDRFKAAVITAAVLHPDLFTDYLGSMGYYEHGQGNMGGTIWEQPERYLRNSPLFQFPRITTPLLIGQGEKDGDLQPSDAIFAALERLGKKVEYRLYQGEGHVLTQRVNVRDFWERRLAFFAEHLDLVYDAGGGIVYDGERARSRGGRPTSP